MDNVVPPSSPPTDHAPRRLARTLRWACRLIAFAIFTATALAALPWWGAKVLPAAASPLVMLGASIATRALLAVAVLGVPMLLLILLIRRGFCRYACPTGLLIDLAGTLNLSARCRRALGPTAPAPNPSAPTAPRTTAGQYLALLTIGAALAGWPILLLLDPLALFSAALGLFHKPLTTIALLSSLLLPAILVISAVWPRLWCGQLCPLGGLQDCINVARKRIARRSPAAPDCAPPAPSPAASAPISAANAPILAGSATTAPIPARRWLLATGVGCAATLLARRLAVPSASASPGSVSAAPLRPPGAVNDPDFIGLCVRCGNCVRACPVHILAPDAADHGIAGLLAPVLRIADRYCKEDCARCGQVCPTGAIRPFTLADKPRVHIGLATFIPAECLRLAERECSACQANCPYEAIEMVFDKKEYTSLPRITPEKCNGCGACQVACPPTPKAIVIKRS